MKISFIFFFAIILLSSNLFAKDDGVVLPREDRNVNALRGLEALKVSLEVENKIQVCKLT